MIRQLYTIKQPRLRMKSIKVKHFGRDFQDLINDLGDTMMACDGAGLAAVQIGVLLRAFVIQSPFGPIALVNPEIIESRGEASEVEGCLSIPGFHHKTVRAQEIVVRAQDRLGKQRKLTADGLLARAIQHELDHLDGILYIDRSTPDGMP